MKLNNHENSEIELSSLGSVLQFENEQAFRKSSLFKLFQFLCLQKHKLSPVGKLSLIYSKLSFQRNIILLFEQLCFCIIEFNFNKLSIKCYSPIRLVT